MVASAAWQALDNSNCTLKSQLVLLPFSGHAYRCICALFFNI
jgi:hypothetical protein